MTTQEIKVGLKFVEAKREDVFSITKVTEKYVFFNTENYPNGWHVGVSKFLRKFNKFGAQLL